MSSNISQVNVINNALTKGKTLVFSESKGFEIYKKKKLPNDPSLVTGHAVYKKINDFVKKNKINLNQSEFDNLDNSLAKKAKKLHSQTSFIKGLFLRIFAPKSWLNKMEEQKLIHDLRDYIQHPSNSDSSSSDSGSSSTSDSSSSGSSSSSESDSDCAIPAAPPPPGVAPAATGGPLTAEEHEKREELRLTKALELRANPKRFYNLVPPPNANELEKNKKSLEHDIDVLKELLKKLPNNITIKQEINSKQASVDQIQEKLSDSRAIQAFNGFNHLNSTFISRVQKLTNDEIKFLLGQYFEGAAPAGTNTRYANNQALLDNVFNQWNALSNRPDLQKFAENKAEWNEYLEIAFVGFVKTLENRALPQGSVDYLPEPNYTPTPFITAAPGAPAAPPPPQLVVTPPQVNQVAPSEDQALLTKLGKMKIAMASSFTEWDDPTENPMSLSQIIG